MNGRFRLGCVLALAIGATLCASKGATKPAEDLVVHEWGTFLSMQGSDGITLDGMYHEEHALPEFVHTRSKDQLRMRSVDLKGETPVIYFYTQQPRTVNVTVGFPEGIWTQWFPQAVQVAPGLAQTASPPEPRHGRIMWRTQLIPAQRNTAKVRVPTTPTDSLWDYARDVDAAYVRTQSDVGPETERFLFYRGLGKATLPLTYTTSNQGTATWQGDPKLAAQDLFVLRVQNGKGSWAYLPEARSGQPVRRLFSSLSSPLPLPEFSKQVGNALAARLQRHGLYAKEARAMVNTWRRSYFQTDGERILYVLPQSWTDRFIPLTITPTPKQMVRVMVGRLEILTPQREQQVEAATRDLASADSAVREKAFRTLQRLGRYAEPVLNRVLAKTADENVRLRCRRLLATGFVTELRANSSPKSGGKTVENPVFVRAQLASLLREIGLNEEAKAEATAALAELQALPEVPLDNSRARHPLRAYARAMEGLGDDAGAATAYRNFITFAVQARVRQQCTSCHRAFNVDGPKDRASWFRDWWAGERFARYATKAGIADQVLFAATKPTAGIPGVEQLLAAYVYASRGDKQHAKRLWTALDARGGTDRIAERKN